MKMASRLIDLISNKTNCTCSTLFLSFPCRCFARLQRCFVPVRACLHGAGGPRIGVLTCGGSPHLSCERNQIKMRDYVDRRVTHQSGLPYRPVVPHPPCKQARKRQTSQLHIIFYRGIVVYVPTQYFVIHDSVNIKNNAENYTTLLLFFISKSPGGHLISFQIKTTLVCLWCGKDGRSLARSVYGHVITKFPRMGRLPHFLSYGARL